MAQEEEFETATSRNVDIVTEDKNLAGQAEHEFGNMMLTAPPRETVMLLCGSLGSTNGTVDPLSDRP